MTESRVALDTWAWWEVLKGSRVGATLRDRYILHGGARPITSAISLGEVSAKLTAQGSELQVPITVASIRHRSEIVDVSSEIAVEAGVLRRELRNAAEDASLADAIVLITARRSGVRLVSMDKAFRGQPDVLRS